MWLLFLINITDMRESVSSVSEEKGSRKFQLKKSVNKVSERGMSRPGARKPRNSTSYERCMQFEITEKLGIEDRPFCLMLYISAKHLFKRQDFIRRSNTFCSLICRK